MRWFLTFVIHQWIWHRKTLSSLGADKTSSCLPVVPIHIVPRGPETRTVLNAFNSRKKDAVTSAVSSEMPKENIFWYTRR